MISLRQAATASRVTGIALAAVLLGAANNAAAHITFGGYAYFGAPPVYSVPAPVIVVPVRPRHPYPVAPHRSLRPVQPLPHVVPVMPHRWQAPSHRTPHRQHGYGDNHGYGGSHSYGGGYYRHR